MKKIIVAVLALVLAAPLFSQVNFGLKAGVSTDFTFTISICRRQTLTSFFRMPKTLSGVFRVALS